MELRRGLWVRPLLEVGRSELRDYLGRRELPWRDDPSNTDLAFLRNRVRHKLLPLIESEIRPGVGKVLLRMSDALGSLETRQRREVAECWKALAPRRVHGAIRLDRPQLSTYDPDLVEGILQRAFRAVSPTGFHLGQAHLRALEQAVRDPVPRQFDLPAGVRAFVNTHEVRLVVSAGME
jgi:tRNA(Ile)-lysidine synthase